MASAKIIFCNLCIILVFGIITVFANDNSNATLTANEGSNGNCSCGGFPTSIPAADDTPLLSQAPGLVVSCDDEGGNTCKNLCNALAIATKAKGPEILCNKLKQAFELKLSAFSKICDRPWTYADITAEEPLCCDDSKVKTCPSVEKLNTTALGELSADVAKTVI